MEIIRNLEEQKLCVIDNEKKLLETGSTGGEFIIVLYTDKMITITRNIDEYLYMNLVQIMNNQYFFDNNGLSYKNDEEIVWFSDQYCDIEDEKQTEMVNRLVIKRIDDKIQITCKNPYFNRENIKKPQNIIAFSSGGNGFYSRNIDSGLSFQTDIKLAFNDILMKEYNKAKIKNYSSHI